MRHPALLSLALALALCAPAARAAAQLTLKAAASVPGPRVTLAELAVIGGDAGATLGALDMGPAPLPGYTTRLARAEVERMLRARGLALAVGGAAAVGIERLTQPAAGADAAAVAERHLRQRLHDQAARIELRLAAPPQELQLPAGKVEYRVRANGRENVLQRRVTVWLEVLVDAVFVRTLALQFEVQAWRPVLVARRELAAGTAPACDAFDTRELDVAALDGAPAGADCGALRGRLKRALGAGAALLQTHLQAELAVTQGDSVDLRVADGAILIEARAVALADGNVGQRIDVQPSNGTRAVRAEVIGPGLVKLTGK